MRLILPFLLLLPALNCCAQIDLINRTMVRKDSNFVFTDLVNELVVTGTKNIHLQLKATHTRITPADSPRLFYIEADKPGTATFTLLQDGKAVLTKTFKIIPSPGLVLRWGALRTDTATAMEVIAHRRMIISLPGSTYCHDCSVRGFDIDLVTGQSSDRNRVIRIEGNTLTPEAASLISKLNHGDKIVFSRILTYAFSCRLREWPGFTIFIK